MVALSPREKQDQAASIAAGLRRVVGQLKRRLREHGGEHDLAPSQIAVILRLDQSGPTTVSVLSRAEGMRPQSMSSVVAPLLAAGLVSSTQDPADGRQSLLSLTPKCEKWLREGRAARQDWLTKTIRTRLTRPEQLQLHAALELLDRLAED